VLDGYLVHLAQEVGDDGQIRGAAAVQDADRILLEFVVVLGYARGSLEIPRRARGADLRRQAGELPRRHARAGR